MTLFGLSALYLGFGESGKTIVEQTFGEIRKGRYLPESIRSKLVTDACAD